QPLAVLELAALEPLAPRQHELLAAACAGLGLHLANLQGAEHNRLLLEETRRQAAALEERSSQIEEASLYSRSLLEASLDPLVTISADGKIMDVNRATESVTGVARDQLIGSDFCDYFTEPEQARAAIARYFPKDPWPTTRWRSATPRAKSPTCSTTPAFITAATAKWPACSPPPATSPNKNARPSPWKKPRVIPAASSRPAWTPW
ncbi:PAS domain S-box protein, partial [Methylogaea oryzae]|uniref:PAS domain S-box protein n=1 Tax=Methylogaea oryzae TaxID=1295382 RepID=UPI0020D0B29C